MENEGGVMKHRQQNRKDNQQLFGWRKLEADDSKLCATELRAYIPDIR